jgi:hypothetical protein
VGRGALGDPSTGERVRRRSPLILAAVLLAAGVAAALTLPVVSRTPSSGAPGDVTSGTWFCPHGGGEGWSVQLEIANPSDEPLPIRVTTFDGDGKSRSEDRTVPGGSTVSVDVEAGSASTSSTVEYFGGWVAAGWVTTAGGAQAGVAAEPCADRTASRWYLPDMSTVEGEDDSIILSNPFAADAVFSVTLLTPGREPTRTDALTNVLLRARHTTAVRLRKTLLGEATVSAIVDVSVGRIAAATLDVTGTTGIRSAIGYAGSLEEPVVLPGALGSGAGDLVTMIPGTEGVALAASLLGTGPAQPVAGLAEAAPTGGSARTFPVSAAEASAIVFESPGVALARRTSGVPRRRGRRPAGPGGAPPPPPRFSHRRGARPWLDPPPDGDRASLQHRHRHRQPRRRVRHGRRDGARSGSDSHHPPDRPQAGDPRPRGLRRPRRWRRRP